MLGAAEAAGTLSDLRTIADIIYRPQIELIDGFGDYSYAGFLSAYLLRYQGSRFGQFGERVAPNLARTLALLRTCLGDLPEAVAQRRLVTASFMFLNILVIHTRDVSDERRALRGCRQRHAGPDCRRSRSAFPARTALTGERCVLGVLRVHILTHLLSPSARTVTRKWYCGEYVRPSVSSANPVAWTATCSPSAIIETGVIVRLPDL